HASAAHSYPSTCPRDHPSLLSFPTRRSSDLGAQAEAFFADFYADKAFLGSGGVHAQAGLTDYHPPEVATRRTIIAHAAASYVLRSEEHTSELQSRVDLVCRLLLEKKTKTPKT